MRRILAKVARWMNRLASEEPYFASDDVILGQNVRFGKNVVIGSKRVRIGDGTHIGDNVTIQADVFEIGDYGTIYSNCLFPGPPGEVRIGHNFWLGQGSIIDGHGGTTIGNNVCVGAQSQLWTHMIFGDVMCGCRFHSVKPLVLEDDVWVVGHSLVSPVRMGARSLAMLGSLITRDVEADRVYGGVPAKDITDKVGPQFAVTTVEDRVSYMSERIEEFSLRFGLEDVSSKIKVVTSKEELLASPRDVTAFNVADRTYTKRRSDLEFKLMRFLLPDAKFVPMNCGG